MNTISSFKLTPIPEEATEIIKAIESTFTAEEVDAIYEDWLSSMEFSPDYMVS
ncbi:MAG: hypothetical protein H6Q65_470 [Firmicutes bacterium]|nr:hypothetical protein [Bacillota bacterium]